ncbi:MAG: hypothetical protein MZV63_29010 [Marinilabiliales bacterium]|nr:hypothetical protein [Marinilabiliales bacterium]
MITSLIISLLIGKRIIQFLQKKQVGEVVRDLGLEGQYQKKGTPSMGGIIILASIIIPVLAVCKARQYLCYSDACHHRMAWIDRLY